MSTDKPWEREPDHVMFMSDAGYICEIKRHDNFGHLCGYIYIPKGHPYFGKTYQELEDEDGNAAHQPHGGWTYSDTKGDDDGALYTVFGFDCNHTDDYAPKQEELLRSIGVDRATVREPSNYRTIEYVTAELETAAIEFKKVERAKT